MELLIVDNMSLALSTKAVLLLIFTIFMPLSAITFFYYMLEKKEDDFKKSLRDMGLESSRTVYDTYKGTHFVLPVFFVTMVCFISTVFVLFAGDYLNGTIESLFLSGTSFGDIDSTVAMRRSAVAIGFAFIGGFVWSASYIIRRLIDYDLAPSVYYTAGLRIIFAVAIAVVFSFAMPKEVASSLPALALLTGMFPERILNWIIDKYKGFIDGDRLLDKSLSLDRIEGISLSHKERLNEIGVDNAQNLASTSLIQLLIETPFQTRLLLDWIGQAKLVVYTKDSVEEFRALGLRTVYDFFKGSKDRVILEDLAEARGIDPILMGLVYEQIIDDHGINNLYKFQQYINMPNDEHAKVLRGVVQPFENISFDS